MEYESLAVKPWNFLLQAHQMPFRFVVLFFLPCLSSWNGGCYRPNGRLSKDIFLWQVFRDDLSRAIILG